MPVSSPREGDLLAARRRYGSGLGARQQTAAVRGVPPGRMAALSARPAGFCLFKRGGRRCSHGAPRRAAWILNPLDQWAAVAGA